MLTQFWNSIKKSLFGLATFLIVWLIISLFYESFMVPSPLTVLQRLSSLITEKSVVSHYWLTMYRLGIGFLFSFFCGTLIGVISYILKINHYIENVMSLLQVVPGVIIGSFLILFYGIGSAVPIGMIIVMITPIVATNTVTGLLDHPKELVEVINVFGGNIFDVIKNVYIPKLYPVFKTNFLICTALSLKIIILGAGQVGGSLAENLAGEENDITVVDSDANRLRDLQNKLEIRIIQGKASYPAVLRQAG